MNFNEFIELCKSLGAKETPDNFYLNINKNNIDFILIFTDKLYTIKITYNESKDLENYFTSKQISFDGAINSTTINMLEVLLTCVNEYIYVFISCCFQKNYEPDSLLDLTERLLLAQLEYKYLLKHILKKEDWDGNPIEIKTNNSTTIFSLINKEKIPALEVSYSKCNGAVNLNRIFSLFDWLLHFENDYSWIDADTFTHNLKALKPLPDEVVIYFVNLFKNFNDTVTLANIKKNPFQLVIKNPNILYMEGTFNDFGVTLKIFSNNRPYKAFKIKLPLRKNIQHTFSILQGFLYLLNNDPNGTYSKSCFSYFKNVESTYMNLFVGLDPVESTKN